MPNHLPLIALLSREGSGLSADWRIVQNMPPSAHREADPQPVRSLEFHRVEDTYWHTAESWREETGREIPAKVAAWALEHRTRTPDPTPPRHRGPWTARRCHPKCDGWIIANGGEIQRCDECDRFRSDAGAVQHVALAHHRLVHAARRALAEMEQVRIKGSLSRDLLWSALKLATGNP